MCAFGLDVETLKRALAPVREAIEVWRGMSIRPGGAEEFTVASGAEHSALIVTIRAAYDPAATAGVRVRWLYSPDGVNFDSVEDAEAAGNYEDLSFAAGATRQRTVVVPLFQPYVKVQVVNLDATYATTVDAWRTLMR